MNKDSVVAIVRALNEHQVRYLIVGGLAVVAHGYVRFTADVDLMLSTDPDNLTSAVAALESLGYRPRTPVSFSEFTDPAARERWARENNMTVFSLFSDSHRATEVDLFLEPPIDFEKAYSRAIGQNVAADVEARSCSFEDLTELKNWQAVRAIRKTSIISGKRARHPMSEPSKHEPNQPDERVWENGWQDHEQRQLDRLAKLPFSEKLAWLEEAHRLVMSIRDESEASGDGTSQ